MRLTLVGGSCPERRDCPTVYATDRGTFVVQGYRLNVAELAQLDLAEDETVVEIPAAVLEEAVSAYRS